MTTLDRWSEAVAYRRWLDEQAGTWQPPWAGCDGRPCPDCDGSGEGKHGLWCPTCGGGGIDPEEDR